MGDPMVLPRARRPGRVGNWWAKAWARSFEETALDAADVLSGRRLARSGRLGAVVVISGMASVVVDPGADGAHTAQLKLDRLSDRDWRRFTDVLAREAGHLAALESGELDARFVEQVDETGVEVLPGPGEFETACDCVAWAQPCVHALALLHQLTWHLDADPYVLLLLRGRTREQLLSVLTSVTPASLPASLPALAAAAERAAAILRMSETAPSGHGLADSAVATYDEAVAALL